jgi:hypothetical protein
MDEVKINKSPCETCGKSGYCNGRCPRWENWFRVTWRALVKPYRELAERKKENELKEKEKKENELN